MLEFLGFLTYTIISSANSESLTSSFPIQTPWIPLCSLIAIASPVGAWKDGDVFV